AEQVGAQIRTFIAFFATVDLVAVGQPVGDGAVTAIKVERQAEVIAHPGVQILPGEDLIEMPFFDHAWWRLPPIEERGVPLLEVSEQRRSHELQETRVVVRQRKDARRKIG